MTKHKYPLMPRTFNVLVLLVLITSFIIPQQPVVAKPVPVIVVNFTIASVIADESVTISTVDFPVRTNFNVIMGTATTKAAEGVVSTDFNSGTGGKADFTFPIPEKVKGTTIIGIRVESKDGYYKGYNWFFNRTQTGLLPDSGLKPNLTFSSIKKNASVTVEATNLNPSTVYRVRVGPYSTFYKDYISYADVTSDNKGIALFTIPLASNSKDAEFISVRLDGASSYVFGTFQNKDGGREAATSELVKIVPCTLLYINPIPPLGPREDFDVVWTIQNTGLEDWNHRRFLFKYRGGEEMHKRSEKVFLYYTIKRGWTYDLAVDMLAPETPGWHTTTWALVNRFDETICKFTVNIFVKQE